MNHTKTNSRHLNALQRSRFFNKRHPGKFMLEARMAYPSDLVRYGAQKAHA